MVIIKPIQIQVTPFVGVWIETQIRNHYCTSDFVTPFVGVWIETAVLPEWIRIPESHPSWVCGLKQTQDQFICEVSSHTLRGCVD